MCGRYALRAGTQDFAELFEAVWSEPPVEMYNIAPSAQVPVITLDPQGKPRWYHMRWGLIPQWAQQPQLPYNTFNIRVENIRSKPVSRGPIVSGRCLVPASAYYEWKVVNSLKQPFCIRPAHLGLMAFAGIFDQWTNPSTGEVLLSFAILTCQALPPVNSVHDRMPVLIGKEKIRSWLSPLTPAQHVDDMMNPATPLDLIVFPTSPAVGNARKNDSLFMQPSSYFKKS